ncbi:MAG TPA: hypothetical protein VHP58_02260 [Alphaproteobacteria bacterium]|nr:hypothetical protein [Alphaproteobacteria bacterium]
MPKTTPLLLKTLTVCCAIILAACGSVPDLGDQFANKRGINRGLNSTGFRVGGIEVGPWWVTMAERGGKSDIVRIYIEGDGQAYITPLQPSGNPTPKKPVALDLAKAENKDGGVFYLARPCQFANLNSQPCGREVWTIARFDEQVMDGYAAAVRKLLSGQPLPETGSQLAEMPGAQVAGRQAVIIGYSGGAAIALEVAKRVPQVIGVITVAGNIDPAATNEWHRVSAMPTAVRPYQYPGRLAEIPVLHLVGAKDEVIRPELTRQVIDGAGRLACTKIEVVPDASHNEGWGKVWPVALPRC